MSFIANSVVSTSTTSSLLQCLSRPGPSRLASRLQPCSACAQQIRQASSSTTESPSAGSTSEAVGDTDADVITPGESTSFQRNAPPTKGSGYDSWLRSVGRQFKDAPTSGPNWLGGQVPYPTNPTFRPPPPLSDALREMIYQEYFFSDKFSSVPASPFASSTEGKTGSINQLSAKHGISKARIEAILRLKIVEKEWEKTNKVLQTPFQASMEQYLGVKSPRPGKDITKRNWNAEKQEKDARLAHPASELEASEESAIDAEGTPLPTSAFTRRDTIMELPGVERNVWEFRSMDLDPVATATGGPAALDVPYNRTGTEGSSAPPHVDAAGETRVEQDLLNKGHSSEIGKKKSMYRFVDTSSSDANDVKLSTRGMGKKQYKKEIGASQGHRGKKAK